MNQMFFMPLSNRYFIGKFSHTVFLSLSQKPDVFTSRLFFFSPALLVESGKLISNFLQIKPPGKHETTMD
jgi:hypothetical protein